MVNTVDVIVIGAGASGLMCAIEAGKRRRSVLVLDHNDRPGKKLLMTGGGRCNFTNYNIAPEHYLSRNPHFCKSALSRYTQWHFLDLINRYGIAFHERAHGQLFCNHSAKDILEMLLQECRQAGTELRNKTRIDGVESLPGPLFRLTTSRGLFTCRALVIATGGLSIPAIGATPFGFKLAAQFGIKVQPPRAALVPFILQPADKKRLAPLAGIAVDAQVSSAGAAFRENLLFTHRGLSGPAILQISSYWQPGAVITINLLPDLRLEEELQKAKERRPQRLLKTVLAEYLPKRLIAALVESASGNQPLQALSLKKMALIAQLLQAWQLKPNGTEGYRTAEVTAGGVDCDAISSKTMESKQVPGLYFIGEVLDVTGWLGGYNLQWAWSSGWCAGQAV